MRAIVKSVLRMRKRHQQITVARENGGTLWVGFQVPRGVALVTAPAERRRRHSAFERTNARTRCHGPVRYRRMAYPSWFSALHTMTAFAGRNCDQPIEVQSELLSAGAARVPCFECGGDGDSAKFHSEREKLDRAVQCVDCKGTGYVLISV